MKRKQLKVFQPSDLNITATPAPLFGGLSTRQALQNSPIKEHKLDNFKKLKDQKGNISLEQNVFSLDSPNKVSQIVKLSEHAQEIMPGLYMENSKYTGEQRLVIYQKNKLINSQIPPGIIISTFIVKQSGFARLFSPEFNLYLCNGKQHLLSAKNYPLSKEVFRISLEPKQFSLKSSNYLGAISSNVDGSHYWIRSPVPHYIQFQQHEKDFQELKGVISYSKTQKQKKMQVILPQQNPLFSLLVNKSNQQIVLSELLEQPTLVLEESKNKEKREECKKDFDLIDGEEDYTYLRLIQQSKNTFLLEIQHPLTIYQAFSIAMTRFEASLK